MTRYIDETERERHDRAIGVWDNEGGASARAPGDEQYGRRIEADRSWTTMSSPGFRPAGTGRR